MGCCGSNRTGRTGPDRVGVVDHATPGSLRLRWRRSVTATVTGPVTAITYRVSAEHRVVAVDSRDASGLLATGFFERVG